MREALRRHPGALPDGLAAAFATFFDLAATTSSTGVPVVEVDGLVRQAFLARLPGAPPGGDPPGGDLVVVATPSARMRSSDEPLSVALTVMTPAGEPVAGADARLAWRWAGVEVRGQTDGTGRARLDLPATALALLRPHGSAQIDESSLEPVVYDPASDRCGRGRAVVRTGRHPIHLMTRTAHALGSDGPITLFLGTSNLDGSAVRAEVMVAAEGAESPVVVADTGAGGLVRVRLDAAQRRRLDAAERVVIHARDAAGRIGIASRASLDVDPRTVTLVAERSVLAPGDPLVLAVDSVPAGRRVAIGVVADGAYVDQRWVMAPARVTVPYQPTMQGMVTAFAVALDRPPGYLTSQRPPAEDAVLTVYRHGRAPAFAASMSPPSSGATPSGRVDLAWTAAGSDAAVALLAIDRQRQRLRGADASLRNALSEEQALDHDDAKMAAIAAIDPRAAVPPGLDAAVDMLGSGNELFDARSGVERFHDAQWRALEDAARRGLVAVEEALRENGSAWNEAEPADPASARAFFASHGVDLDALRDPWQRRYRVAVEAERAGLVLRLVSAGLDGAHGTDDDQEAFAHRWTPFDRHIEAVHRAVASAFEQRRAFITDADALATELATAGIDWHALRDPSGRPYSMTTFDDDGVLEITIHASDPASGERVPVLYTALPYAAHAAGKVIVGLMRARRAPWPADRDELLTWLHEGGVAPSTWRTPSGDLLRLVVRAEREGQAIELWRMPADPAVADARSRKLLTIERTWFDALVAAQRADEPAADGSADGALYLTAVSRSGAKMPGVALKLRRLDADGQGPVRTVMTDRDGNARVPGLPAGRYAVASSGVGLSTTELSIVQVSGQRNHVSRVFVQPIVPICRLGMRGQTPPFDTEVYAFPEPLGPKPRTLVYDLGMLGTDATDRSAAITAGNLARWDLYALAAADDGSLTAVPIVHAGTAPHDDGR